MAWQGHVQPTVTEMRTDIALEDLAERISHRSGSKGHSQHALTRDVKNTDGI